MIVKICDLCGHANYTVIIINKKPTCKSCGRIMSEAPQCKPTRKNQCGQPLQGETKKLYSDYDPENEIM